MTNHRTSRREAVRWVIASAILLAAGPLWPKLTRAEEDDDATLMKRFEYLSTNGNSNCSGEFMASIAAMPATQMIQGACCAPMEAKRYVDQVKALRAYAEIADIPSDPYDIPAGLAQRLLSYDAIALTGAEQVAYDYAMTNSEERGPCCCQCWRWHTYGGLAKRLIREKKFTGEQVTKVWDLSNGCGGQG